MLLGNALALHAPWTPVSIFCVVRHVIVPLLGGGCPRNSSNPGFSLFLLNCCFLGIHLALGTHLTIDHIRTTEV